MNGEFVAGHHRSQASKEDEIDVEFDDGDSGRMPISLIRLLPPDYPVTGNDFNVSWLLFLDFIELLV